MNKQWNETLVLTLAGVIRVFKAFLPLFLSERVALSNVDEIWKKLFDEIIMSAINDSTEVSVAAIQSMQDLLLTHAVQPNFPRRLWDISWSAVDDMGRIIREKVSESMNEHSYTTLLFSILFAKFDL